MFDFNDSPSLSKSVKITYSLSLGSFSTKSSTDTPEMAKISFKPNFSNANLSLFPSTITEKSNKSFINLSIL